MWDSNRTLWYGNLIYMATGIIMKHQIPSQYLNDGISFWWWDVFPWWCSPISWVSSSSLSYSTGKWSFIRQRFKWVLGSSFPVHFLGVNFWERHLGSSIAARVCGPGHAFGTALTVVLRRFYLVWSIWKGSGLQLSILLVFFEQISIHRHNQALKYSQLWFKWSLLMKCKFNKTVTWSASAH